MSTAQALPAGNLEAPSTSTNSVQHYSADLTDKALLSMLTHLATQNQLPVPASLLPVRDIITAAGSHYGCPPPATCTTTATSTAATSTLFLTAETGSKPGTSASAPGLVMPWTGPKAASVPLHPGPIAVALGQATTSPAASSSYTATSAMRAVSPGYSESARQELKQQLAGQVVSGPAPAGGHLLAAVTCSAASSAGTGELAAECGLLKHPSILARTTTEEGDGDSRINPGSPIAMAVDIPAAVSPRNGQVWRQACIGSNLGMLTTLLGTQFLRDSLVSQPADRQLEGVQVESQLQPASGLGLRALQPSVDVHRTGPEGHIWKRYGHKKLSGQPVRRYYYGCVQSDKLGCKAKKIVNRLCAEGKPPRDHVTFSGTHNHPPEPEELSPCQWEGAVEEKQMRRGGKAPSVHELPASFSRAAPPGAGVCQDTGATTPLEGNEPLTKSTSPPHSAVPGRGLPVGSMTSAKPGKEIACPASMPASALALTVARPALAPLMKFSKGRVTHALAVEASAGGVVASPDSAVQQAQGESILALPRKPPVPAASLWSSTCSATSTLDSVTSFGIQNLPSAEWSSPSPELSPVPSSACPAFRQDKEVPAQECDGACFPELAKEADLKFRTQGEGCPFSRGLQADSMSQNNALPRGEHLRQCPGDAAKRTGRKRARNMCDYEWSRAHSNCKNLRLGPVTQQTFSEAPALPPVPGAPVRTTSQQSSESQTLDVSNVASSQRGSPLQKPAGEGTGLELIPGILDFTCSWEFDTCFLDCWKELPGDTNPASFWDFGGFSSAETSVARDSEPVVRGNREDLGAGLCEDSGQYLKVPPSPLPQELGAAIVDNSVPFLTAWSDIFGDE